MTIEPLIPGFGFRRSEPEIFPMAVARFIGAAPDFVRGILISTRMKRIAQYWKRNDPGRAGASSGEEADFENPTTDKETAAENRLSDTLARFLFLLSIVFAAYVWGLASGFMELPPTHRVLRGIVDAADLVKYWKNDLKIEPTRLLVDSYKGANKRVVVFDRSRMSPGDRLVAGLTAGRAALDGAILLNEAGEEVHYWPIDYEKLDPHGRNAEHVFLHGLLPLRDGSLIVNFDDGNVLARVDACGKAIWRTPGHFHHAVTRADNGSLWTPEDEKFTNVDVATGTVLKRIDLRKDIIARHHLQGIFSMQSAESKKLQYFHDPFHINHVEALKASMADAFPLFDAGDLLISLRNINLIAVLDGHSADVKWWQVGPWHRQHNPHFLPDGRISIFNNNMAFGKSQILTIDPETRKVDILFEGNDKVPFYSWRRGKHRVLENGNILITEAEKGRAFEVTAGGNPVWEYNNIFDKSRNGLLNKAIALPTDFFQSGALECQQIGAK